MKQFDSGNATERISRIWYAAAFWGVTMLGGCGQFDGSQATTAETFSNRKVRALSEAAATGDVKKIDALVKEGVDVNAKGRGNVTPLLHCLWRQNKEGYEALLRHKADPNMLDRRGSSVVHEAAQEADPFWLRLALEHDGDANLINKGNRYVPNATPLYYAIHAGALELKAGRVESVKLLIAAGADLNHQDGSGSNPLREAAEVGNFEIVLMLLEAGADFRKKNQEGHTVVDMIRRRHSLSNEGLERVVREKQRPWFRKVVEFLKAKGVDLTTA